MNIRYEKVTQGTYYLLVVEIFFGAIGYNKDPLIPAGILKIAIWITLLVMILSIILFYAKRKTK